MVDRLLDASSNLEDKTSGRRINCIRPVKLSITRDSRVSTNAYNALGQLSSRTGAGSVPVSYDYDAASRMTKLIDGEANKTDFAYDGGNRLTQKTYADNSFYAYSYNPRGWLTLRTDPKGCQTAYSYNNDGQLTNVNYASDVDVQYAFDTMGRMTSRVDAAGTWTWTYDGDSSRVLNESCSGASYTSSVSYTYHPTTYERASVSCGSYTTEYFWAQGRLTNVTSVCSACSVGSFSYSYVPNSDLLSEMTNSVFFTRRSYDALSRLTNISSSVSSVVNSFSYSLDSTGRRTARQDADGSQLSWGYDSFDQLTSASRTNSPNGAADKAYNFQYQYDLVGNHLHEDRGQLDLDGTFNPLNQLTYRKFTGRLDVYGSVDNTNGVMVVGGVTSAPPFYGTTNWWGNGAVSAGSNAIPIVANVGTNSTQTNLVVFMPTTNPQQFLWDRNGNLTNDGQRVFTWTEENRLASIETTAAVVSNGMPKRRAEFLYDGMGRRIEKVDYSSWNGTAYATTNTTQFTWDRWNLLSETISNQQSTITNSYVWGLDLSQSLQGAGGIGGLLCVIQNGQQYFPCYDGNGNITDYLDASGTVVAHYEYDPFGRTVAATGSKTGDLNFRFSTKYFEAFWNLYYYGLRFYEPGLGRWTSRDPKEHTSGAIGDPDTYTFVHNCPPDKKDMLGRFVLTVFTTPMPLGNKFPNTCGAFAFQRKWTVQPEKSKKEEFGEHSAVIQWIRIDCEGEPCNKTAKEPALESTHIQYREAFPLNGSQWVDVIHLKLGTIKSNTDYWEGKEYPICTRTKRKMLYGESQVQKCRMQGQAWFLNNYTAKGGSWQSGDNKGPWGNLAHIPNAGPSFDEKADSNFIYKILEWEWDCPTSKTPTKFEWVDKIQWAKVY